MDIMKFSLIAVACQLASGIAYMNYGDYGSALNQFDTIIVNHPDSQLCDDAMYYSINIFPPPKALDYLANRQMIA